MIPSDYRGRDLNRLPYFVLRGGNHQSVHFEALTEEDEGELLGPSWSHAIFRSIWPHFSGDPRAFKLVCTGDANRQIQGIVRLGSVMRTIRSGGYLRHSLLESAPSNQYTEGQRTYRGVGRVLAARLVAQSCLEGGQGRVLIHPRPGTEPFYLRLGFKRVEQLRHPLVRDILRSEQSGSLRNILVLDIMEAAALIEPMR